MLKHQKIEFFYHSYINKSVTIQISSASKIKQIYSFNSCNGINYINDINYTSIRKNYTLYILLCV